MALARPKASLGRNFGLSKPLGGGGDLARSCVIRMLSNVYEQKIIVCAALRHFGDWAGRRAGGSAFRPAGRLAAEHRHKGVPGDSVCSSTHPAIRFESQATLVRDAAR